MRAETCRPSLAKGSVLAKAVRLPAREMAAGTIMGNDEIELINRAKIERINVLWMGLSDLISHAAATKVAKGLAAGQLEPLPARGSFCELQPTMTGLLMYEAAKLRKALADHPDFKLALPAARTLVSRHKPCIRITCSRPVVVLKLAQDAADAMPPVHERPCMPVKLAVLRAKGEDKPALAAIRRQVKLYGSPNPQLLDMPADDAAWDATLVAMENCDVLIALSENATHHASLAQMLAGHGQRVTLSVGEGSTAWYTANIGKTTVVALPAAKGNAAALRRLLDLLHAGVALEADALLS